MKYKLSLNTKYVETYNYWINKLNNYKNMKRISANTVIYIDYKTKDIVFELHGYPIIKQHKDNTFTLNNFGWETSTTKRRMNQFSPCNIYQSSFNWYLYSQENEYKKAFPFFNNVKIDWNGNVLNN